MTKSTMAALAIAGIALSAVLIMNRQSRALDKELEEARTQITALQATTMKTETAHAMIDKVAEELEEARFQIARLQAEASARATATIELKEAGASLADASVVTAGKSVSENGKLRSKYSKKQTQDKNGEEWDGDEWSEAVGEMMINDRYTRLFGMLNLPVNVESSMRTMLADYLPNLEDVKSGWGRNESGATREQLHEALASVLTQEELDTWEDYEDGYPQYEMEQHFATELRNFGPGLTPENREMAAVILAEELTAAQHANTTDDDAGAIAAWRTALEQSGPRLAEYFGEEQYWELERFLAGRLGNLAVKEEWLSISNRGGVDGERASASRRENR